MRVIKRLMALTLSLLLLMMNAANAEIPFLVYSNGWNLEDTPVEVVLKAVVDTHMPFDEERLSMLTPITDILSLRLETDKDEGRVTVGISGDDKLSLQYRGNAVQISCMPDVVYTAESDPLSVLLGAGVSVTDGYSLLNLSPDGEALIQEGRALLAKIPEALEGHGKRSKNSTKISGYGEAAYIIDYSFTVKTADTFRTILLESCPDGHLQDILNGLVFSGKQSLRIYFTAEDVILRAEYNGSCGPQDDLRTVKLVYKLRHDEEIDKDYIELTSPAKKSKNKNNLEFERTVQTNQAGARTVVGSYKYSVTKNDVASVWTGDFNLRNAFSEVSDLITGEMTFQSKLNGAEKYDAVILAPSLSISGNQDEPVITGTVEITEKYANRVTEHAVVSVDLKRGEKLEWIEQSNTVDLSAMDEQKRAGIQMELAAAIATELVRPLIVTLGKDAQWFFRDLSEEAIHSILDMAENAQ